MTTASLPLTTRARFDVGRTLRAGAVLGVGDFTAAMVVYVLVMRITTPVRLWQGVARSILGKSTFDGGLATAAVGVAIHFCVALGWATVYALLYHYSSALRRLTRTTAGTIAAGALFGAFVQVMMSMVIVPMTLIPANRTIGTGWLVGLAIHMLVVGQAAAWMVRDRA